MNVSPVHTVLGHCSCDAIISVSVIIIFLADDYQNFIFCWF